MTLNASIFNEPVQRPRHATFVERVSAYVIDFFILSPLLFLSILNIIKWKNVFVFCFIVVSQILYKILFEANKGCTIGKALMKITVLKNNYGKAKWKEVLLRNLIYVVARIIYLIVWVNVLDSEVFGDTNAFKEGRVYIEGKMLNISRFIFMAQILDVIIFFASKKRKTLHDKIVGTIVVKTR